MRIVKSSASGALRTENERLGTQMARCRRQMATFACQGLDALRGQGVEAARQRVHMRTAVATAHLAFYESLRQANMRCSGLVSALPETTPGVLDTSLAMARRDEAQRNIQSLQQQMADALSQAERNNAELDAAFAQGGQTGTCIYIDTWAIEFYYRSLIRAQEQIVQVNEDILTRARQFEADALATYQSVQTYYLTQATDASKHYALTGTWGNVTWAARMYEGLAEDFAKRLCAEGATAVTAARTYLRGELKTGNAALSGEASGRTTFVGLSATGAAKGSVLGFSASIKPYSKMSEKESGEDSASFGIKAKAEASVAEVGLDGDVGLLHADVGAKVLTGAVSGTVGGSLFHEGRPSPGVETGVEAEASALSAEGNLRLGTVDYNAHGKAEGKVATTKAEAKIRVGSDGIEAKAGAEAYVATGEVSGGVTLFGISVDLSVEGKFGGAGASAGGQVGPTMVEGEIGAGLALGVGFKVKVDWSGAVRAADNTIQGIAAWWNDLWGPEANRHVVSA